MTADKALSKEEFAEKYMTGTPYTLTYKDGQPHIISNNFLSDLNALLRAELIKYDKWCESQSTAALILLSTEELVDKYLKSQQ
jgi:hypothetical protein